MWGTSSLFLQVTFSGPLYKSRKNHCVFVDSFTSHEIISFAHTYITLCKLVRYSLVLLLKRFWTIYQGLNRSTCSIHCAKLIYCSRFIINVPEAELSSVERICFQVEQAHWFYEDFIRELRPELPSFQLKTFSARNILFT